MSKPMTAFTTDLQHSGMIAKDLDETIEFYTKKLGFEVASFIMARTAAHSCVTAI